MFNLFKKKKLNTYTKLIIWYKNNFHYDIDAFEIKGKSLLQEYEDLEKWWLTSKKRYFKFVYAKGVLLLDKEKIRSIKRHEYRR